MQTPAVSRVSYPCRLCRGLKVLREVRTKDGKETVVELPCYHCRGTGREGYMTK